MSGDVQPRRRRDKKKKKEEPIEETIQHQQPIPIPTPIIVNDDVNIHVHKESTLGGGICAKSIFFILMIAISVLIGFTITEHRGQTDVDIPTSESRFASIFEGWVDKSPDTHDDDDHHGHSEELSHEESEEQEEMAESEEEAEEEEVEVEESEEAPTEEEEEEEEEESAQDTEEDVSQDVDEEEEGEEEGSEEVTESQEEDQIAESEEEEEDVTQSNEGDEEDEEEAVDSERSEEDEEGSDEQNDEEEEETTSKEIKTEDVSEEKDTPDDEQEDSKEVANEQDDAEIPADDEVVELSAADMAAKIGVGLSLLIVAYVVLVKKWRSDKTDEQDGASKVEEIPDLTRRNTFVPPPTLEEIEQDIENVEEDYSDEEDEQDEESDDDRRNMPSTKKNYEELRSKYNRSYTPDSENSDTKKKYGDSDREEEEYEYEDEEEGEEEQDNEEEEEEEGNYEDDDEYDEDLMKKLEERYGRLDAKNKYGDEEVEDEEEVEEEEEEGEDNSQFQSWKRIKKIDNGAESESDDDKNAKSKAKSGAQNVAYEFENITNADDYLIRDELDNAQGNIMNNIQLALSLFTKILEKHPNSPRALYGTAQALDLWADKKRSNEVLQESIQYYTKVLNINSTPNILFSTVGERCINRMRFMGNYGRSIGVHKKLIERFPNESKYKNDLAVTYLTMNRIPEARSLLVDILKTWPNNGFALVHYGFILKTVDNELNKAVDYLMKGINTRESGVIDGRFYFHLGDALARLGRRDEAAKIYVDGVENKVFLSKYQRSLYNVDRLTGKPWWKKEQTPYTRLYQQLETHYREIRNEALAILNQKGYFKDESENLRDVGNWKQFELYARGSKHVENCKKCPITCKIIDSEPDVKNCRRGQVKFSVMHPGTHVWPHCGPTNCRLRIHLGLRVPPKTYIRVAEETRTWENGRIFIFDDSFEHEVWHNGTEVRLVLIVDVWHPELKKSEKYNLSAI